MGALSCGGRTLTLSARELEIMRLLMVSQHAIVPKETLLLKVWGYDSDVNDNSVEAYISFLRKKLTLLRSPRDAQRNAQVGLPIGGGQGVIRKLRKKLIVVLMAVVCLFLVGILTSLFITSRASMSDAARAAFASRRPRRAPPSRPPTRRTSTCPSPSRRWTRQAL